jgi:predicted esterase
MIWEEREGGVAAVSTSLGEGSYYARSCAAARDGDVDLALTLLRQALDEGGFFGEAVLRESPSWRVLQGTPAFEELAARSLDRYRRAPRQARLLVEVDESVAAPYPALVTLHGNGDDGEASLHGWRAAREQGWLLAAIQSSEVLAKDAYGWEDEAAALRDVEQQFGVLAETDDIDPRRAVIAGFSLGGRAALHAVLTRRVPATGLVLYGTAGRFLREPVSVVPLVRELVASGAALRAYVAVGELDELYPTDGHRRLAETLAEEGIPCGFEVLPGVGHEYPDDFAPVIRRALAFVIPPTV